MKVAFVDEVVGLAGNSIPDQLMNEFQKKRKKRFKHYKPALVHW